MNKIQTAFFVLIIMSIGALLTLFVALFYPYKTLEISEINIPKQVIRGGVFNFRIDACKYTKKSATVRYTLANDVMITLSPKISDIPIGCYDDVLIEVPIPEMAPSGKYHLVADVEYEMNHFRTIEKHFESEEFYIVDKMD